MIEKRRDPLSGLTMNEWIDGLPMHLKDIGRGLAGIVQTGREGFALEGAALVDFVRRCLHTLVAHGARVSHAGSPAQPDRHIELHYGDDTPEHVVEGVIADWVADGMRDLEWGDFWFAVPGTFDPVPGQKVTVVRKPAPKL